MEVLGSEIHQVFVKLIDGKHKILNFESPKISVCALKNRIQALTSIPSHIQLLCNNSRVLHDDQTLTLDQSRENPQFSETLNLNEPQFGAGKLPVVVHLLLRLRGGKGGFGSLLRGAATKAGQKKTNNFDACRDMSGRRLRHVNAEKKLEEWRAEAEERKLEKMAEEFIKKKVKEVSKSGKRNGGDNAEKYVAKYREDSAKCMEEVERSVRDSIQGLASSKRKSGAGGKASDSKRLKIWMGKRKFGDSDSEDMDEDDSDGEKEGDNEKSVIIDNGSHSDSSKEAEGSSDSITGGKLDRVSAESGSEEEHTVVEESLKSYNVVDRCVDDVMVGNEQSPALENLEENIDHNGVDTEVPDESYSGKVDEAATELPGVSGSEEQIASAAGESTSPKSVPVEEEPVPVSVTNPDSDKPLNFDEIHSAADLEILGMERLKSELLERGLKCGGTLQERAARLFLLKTTPLEKLPKKLFAKK